MDPLIRLDYTNMEGAFTQTAWDDALHRLADCHRRLYTRSGEGSGLLGWLSLPEAAGTYLPDIADAARTIREMSDVLLVIGIGGSSLGARAVIEAMTPPFGGSGIDVLYAGCHIDGEYLSRLLAYLEGKQVSLNIVSKSGTTTEPAIAFRVLKAWMEKRYGKDQARRRIYATTDPAEGALRKLSVAEGYRTFPIPSDIGGRFSVLSPVGLLPIAAAGVSIGELVDGAGAMAGRTAVFDPEANAPLVYALLRTVMYEQGKNIEVLATFSPALTALAEWWKQLFGESEGKDGKGLFPASVAYTTDLHSLGQYLQEGMRNLFETFITVDQAREDISLPDAGTDDGLQYLAGKALSWVNHQAYRSTASAHRAGGVPNMTITLPALTPHAVGALLFFFEVAVALSGYALGINPFDQPGVEAYKKNMFALLGKPGFDELRSDLAIPLEGKRTQVVG